MNRRVAKFEIEVYLDDVPGWGHTEDDWVDHFRRRCIPGHYFHDVRHISTETRVIPILSRDNKGLEQRLVFDANMWGRFGDKGDNSVYWKPAIILRKYPYPNEKDELCDVDFGDGRISTGHFYSATKPIED